MAKRKKTGRLSRMNATGVGKILSIVSTIELIAQKDIDIKAMREWMLALVKVTRESLKEDGYIE